eukprot:223129_1
MSHKKRTRRRVTFMTTDRFKKLTHQALYDMLTDEHIIATFDSIFCLKNSIYSSFLDIEEALSEKKRLNKQIARFDDCKLDLEADEMDSLDLLLSSPSNIKLISDLEKAYSQPQGAFTQIGSHRVKLNINEITASTTKHSIEPTHDDIDVALKLPSISIAILPAPLALTTQSSDPSNYKTDTNPPREREKKRRKKKKNKGGKRHTTTIQMETTKRRARKQKHKNEQEKNNTARRPKSAGTNVKKWDTIEKERKARKKKRIQSDRPLPPKRMSTTALLDQKRNHKIFKKREEIKRIKAKRKAQMGSDNLWKIRNEYTKKSAQNILTKKRSSLIVKADATKWDRNWDIIKKQRVEIRKLKEKRKREKEERERRERERRRRHVEV